MPRQTEIYMDVPLGAPGARADLEPSVYAGNFLSEGAGVKAGSFVWRGTAANQVKSPGTGAPLGLVERNVSFPNYDLASSGTLAIPAGWEVTVAIKGRYFVLAPAAAIVGQKVFTKTADGSISFAAAGATVTGSVETPWSVVTAGAAGDIIIIQNF